MATIPEGAYEIADVEVYLTRLAVSLNRMVRSKLVQPCYGPHAHLLHRGECVTLSLEACSPVEYSLYSADGQAYQLASCCQIASAAHLWKSCALNFCMNATWSCEPRALLMALCASAGSGGV